MKGDYVGTGRETDERIVVVDEVDHEKGISGHHENAQASPARVNNPSIGGHKDHNENKDRGSDGKCESLSKHRGGDIYHEANQILSSHMEALRAKEGVWRVFHKSIPLQA